jgi:hypothetical protein
MNSYPEELSVSTSLPVLQIVTFLSIEMNNRNFHLNSILLQVYENIRIIKYKNS